jgi:hypothetical protein
MMAKAEKQAQDVYSRLLQESGSNVTAKNALRKLLSLVRRCHETLNVQISMHFETLDAEFASTNPAVLSRFKHSIRKLARKCETTLQPSRQLTALNGLCSFVYFPNVGEKLKMKILILGEYHTTSITNAEGEADDVPNWLWDLAEDAPECLDIFVEDSHRLNQERNSLGNLEGATSGLAATCERFEDCVRDGGQGCPPALRYHVVDVRTNREDEKTTEFWELMVSSMNHSLEKTKYKWTEIKLHQVFSCLLGFSTDSALMHEFVTSVYKDLIGTGGEKTSLDVEAVFKDMALIQRDIHRQLRKSILFRERILDVVAGYKFKHPVVVWASLMDMFLLARLFSQFDHSKMARGPLFCTSNKFQTVKNAIIFCGDAHQKFVTFFISNYFEVTPTINKQCKSATTMCTILDEPFDFFSPR